MVSKQAFPPIFTADNLQQVKDAQRKLHDLLPLMDAAAQCGVPVEGYRSIAAGLQVELQAMETNFMKNLKG